MVSGNPLDEYWYSPTVGYKSGEKFYLFLKENGLLEGRTKKEVIDYVNNQSAKQKLAPYHRTYSQYKALYPYDEFQCDLAFIQGKTFFVVIDVFSRKADVEYMPNKKAETALIAYETCLKRSYNNRKPDKLYHDDGSEFKGVFTQENRKIAVTAHKAGYVERFIWTFKLLLSRMVETRKQDIPEKANVRNQPDKNVNRRNFMDFIPNVVENYNNTYHSAIGMSPNEAFEKRNYVKVAKHMIDRGLFDVHEKPSFNVGDKVRIRNINEFNRIGSKRWTDEVYTIKERVEGTFYVLEEDQRKMFHYSNLTLVERHN